ncbi:hypothetical protein [Chitinophaga nivalis]|uniref:Uncharacterized protein n=1 Tax=Chitinophaga nivalis TaxID=2991709 RepID=A0ABT3II79_9BACT|nr:hypothetical protein [Chitinophaga nivalis]MCW3466645.1 hypothetical protein [Chitinophaga nivalis]MCW3483664.1 hypothetical protein [Chitinophaga nivalis]
MEEKPTNDFKRFNRQALRKITGDGVNASQLLCVRTSCDNPGEQCPGQIASCICSESPMSEEVALTTPSPTAPSTPSPVVTTPTQGPPGIRYETQPICVGL